MNHSYELEKILPKELLDVSYTSPPEYSLLAWYGNDAKKVLDYLHEKKHIILGGEVLTKQGSKLNLTWHYWNYDVGKRISQQENVDKSYVMAIEYIVLLSKNVEEEYLFQISIEINQPLNQIYG